MKSFVLAAMFALLAITVPLTVFGSDDLPDLERGAALYGDNCARCHNARGPTEYSDQHWPMIVTHMRVIAGLPGDQARAIEAFLLATNNPAPRRIEGPRASATPEDGNALIQKLGCRGCHMLGNTGGTIGPALDGLLARRDEEWVRVQVQTPRAHNEKTVMPQLGLTDAEVSAIIGALRSATAE